MNVVCVLVGIAIGFAFGFAVCFAFIGTEEDDDDE